MAGPMEAPTAATALDSLPSALAAMDEDEEAFAALFEDEAAPTAPDATAAPTAVDAATTAADPATTAVDPATAAPEPATAESRGAAGGGVAATLAEPLTAEDEEMLAQVEAALFSGTEDEAEDDDAQTLQRAIERLDAKDGASTPAAQAATSSSAAAAGVHVASAPAAASAGQAPEAVKLAAGAGAAAAGDAEVPPPPPPPPEPRPPVGGGGEDDDDEGRYTLDQNGDRIHKWLVNYASRAGGGRAMCKDNDCLLRCDQGGEKFIEKGDLRIGRRVLMAGRHEGDEGHIQIMWYHARCMFNTFLRSRKSTRVIKSAEDLEGFAHIEPEDQDMLRRFIASNDECRGWRGRGSGGTAGAAKRSLETPEKAGGGGARGGAASSRISLDEPNSKRPRVNRSLAVGQRVWTFCRVRPPVVAGAPPGASSLPVKSAKPELGMVFEEEKDGSVIIQFERAEDEKERLAMYLSPKKAKIKGWLRYPRIFEGKKQRIPVQWIQFNRLPPRLCGCSKQEWGHMCQAFTDGGERIGNGISCNRGTSRKVWGVGQ